MEKPDYHGASIVNLMASFIAARGGRSTYQELETLPGRELRHTRNLILIIIDGLGYDYLLRSRAGERFRAYLRAGISSVFPSTTATAVTSFLTGTAPQQHGITGWFTYLEEIGRVTVVLPFRDRESGQSLDALGYDARTLFGHTPVFDLMDAPSHQVTPAAIAYSPFNAAHKGRAEVRPYETMTQFFDTISAAVRERAGFKYVYAYWPQLDGLAHEQGIDSQAAANHLATLDTAFGLFIEKLEPGTTVVVCADHGMIDSEQDKHIDLGSHPRFAETLALPLCGEQRVAFCYVRNRKRRQFEEYARRELAHCAELVQSAELIAHGYFGLGQPHPRLKDRVGDFALLMKHNYTIKDWLPGEKHFPYIGAHGGLSREEMFVPLIVVQR